VSIGRGATRRMLAAVFLVVLVSSCSGTDEAGGPDAAASADATGATDFSDIPKLVDRVVPKVVTVLTDTGLGSGVIYDGDGTIVTNAHVVGEAQQVTVTFADGSVTGGELVAADPGVDLAVVRTDRNDLDPAEFSDRTPAVGELAVAIGSPLGFQETVTAGIISGVDRSIPGGGTSLVGLLQTDAAISPGNSGGALVGASGKVMGINVAYIPPAGGAVAIGFAIPSAEVVDIADELLATGHAEHPVLGIVSRPLTPQLAEQYGIGESGVLVIEVVPGSPAEAAGIRASEVITRIDGKRVDEPGDLLAELRTKDPGDRVELRLLREGHETTVDVELGAATQAQG
jgi:S1-C subfamily serine protease